MASRTYREAISMREFKSTATVMLLAFGFFAGLIAALCVALPY